MNIALFTDSYIPTKSGIVTVVVQLRSILEQLGHHVVIVTVSNGYTDHELEADTNLLRLYAMPTPFGNDQYFGFPNKKKVIDFLKEHNIEIIHAHTEFSIGQMALKAGKQLHIPVIATTHTMWEDYYRYYLSAGKIIPKKLIRKIVKKLYKHFYALINVSQKAKDYFTLPDVLPKLPCSVIPNAIDSEKFIAQDFTAEEKAEIRKQYNIKETDKVVLYVGRIVEEKRVLELLEIVKRVVKKQDNIKMLFVGSGDPVEAMKKDVIKENLQDKIIFTGFISWDKVSKLYSLGDVFVTTSLSEMHSMTILEALFLGIPVVCREDSSYADTIFHGENGFKCNKDEELDDYILQICNDDELHEKMSNKALEISLHFTLKIHGVRTEAFYKHVLSNYPKRITSASLDKAIRKAEEGL